jgi:hypothetical protein
MALGPGGGDADGGVVQLPPFRRELGRHGPVAATFEEGDQVAPERHVEALAVVAGKRPLPGGPPPLPAVALSRGAGDGKDPTDHGDRAFEELRRVQVERADDSLILGEEWVAGRREADERLVEVRVTGVWEAAVGALLHEAAYFVADHRFHGGSL